MPPTLTGDLHTALTAAAFAPISRAFLRITGPDATRWLNGMVTNNITALTPGQGNQNFLLNAQGRIQATATIYRDPNPAEPTYLLETDPTQLDTIHQLLEKFIIMDDVELTPTLTHHHSLLLLGPDAPALVASLHPNTGPTPHLTLTNTTTLLSQTLASLPTFQLFDPNPLTPPPIPQLPPETLEQLRILEARPRFATDIRTTDLPQETNQPHFLHFAKGCYLGQEIVERIRSRGQVHRLLTPFRLHGNLPTTFPTPLTANGKPAGELTSAATLPTTEGPIHLALGYARREALQAALDTQATLTYPHGTATPRAANQLS